MRRSLPIIEAEQSLIDDVLNMSYTSYNEDLISQGSNAIDLLSDNFAGAILNKDFILQVGDYIYRINKLTEKVYVLPAAKITRYSDLVSESKTNPDVRKFSTSDEVILLAESGALGEEKCGDRYANSTSGTSPNTNVMINPAVTMYIKASYKLWGLWFTLKAEGKHTTVSSGDYKFYFQLDNCSWRQRCSGAQTSLNYSHPWRVKDSGTTSGNVQTENFIWYRRTKQLRDYTFKVRFRCENWLQPTTSQSYTTYFTEYVYIQDV